ncbi:MAG: class I SAM-dependent methyltransferase [Desulfobacterales bacterium]
MGYVFDFNDAIYYDEWMNHSRNRWVVDLEKRLMLEMLQPVHGERIIDIGCGTGSGLQTFLDSGLRVTGIDASPYMLDIASKKIGNRVDLHRGFAEDLPFDDNSFNYASLITTLEFVDDPKKAIEEASRVAKDKIFLGVLNRYAIKGVKRRIKGVFTRTIYNHAHFFSVWELKDIIRSLLGDVPASWKTVCQFSNSPGRITGRIEQFSLIQKCPFGAFIGMGVTLVPRFRTRPLTVPYKAKHTTGEVPG